MATARSDAWQEQPFFLEYQHEGTEASVHAGCTGCLGQAPGSRGNQRGLRGRFAGESNTIRADPGTTARARAFLSGVEENRRSARNLAWLMPPSSCVTASVLVPASEHERIRRMFSLTPELRLRTFCENPMAVQKVLRLVLDGKLHIDWWEPLGLDSRISTSPIGRQVWPFPPSEASGG